MNTEPSRFFGEAAFVFDNGKFASEGNARLAAQQSQPELGAPVLQFEV
jgi:hypothetical protein